MKINVGEPTVVLIAENAAEECQLRALFEHRKDWRMEYIPKTYCDDAGHVILMIAEQE